MPKPCRHTKPTQYRFTALSAAILLLSGGCVIHHTPPTVSSSVINSQLPNEILYSVEAKYCLVNCEDLILTKAQELCPREFSIQQRSTHHDHQIMIIRCPKIRDF